MVLAHRQILDIVILAYYAIALILSLWLVVKHGFARQIGRFYLALLAILRLIGAGTAYASINHPASQELLETSVICTSISISPLLLALLGILSRINNGMNGYRLSNNWSRIIHIPVIVGLILAIVAGTKQFSSNPSTLNTREHLLEGAVILYTAGFASLAAMAMMLFGKRPSIRPGESQLLVAALLSLPFIFVRILYSVISAFDHDSSTFSIENDTNTAVIVQAIMSVLMEFIAVAIFILASLVTSS